jgi:sulfite reductase (ferredoxin)
MLKAARALVKTSFLDVVEDPETVVEEFRRRFYDTQIFFDKFGGGRFAHYLFMRHSSPPLAYSHDSVHRTVEEAQLFIEAAYACHDRITERRSAAASVR